MAKFEHIPVLKDETIELLNIKENGVYVDGTLGAAGHSKAILEKAKIKIKITDKLSLAKAIIELGFYSKSKLFIMPYSDVVLLDSDYRINQPGVVNSQNWSIRFSEKHFTKKAQKTLLNLTKKYNR